MPREKSWPETVKIFNHRSFEEVLLVSFRLDARLVFSCVGPLRELVVCLFFTQSCALMDPHLGHLNPCHKRVRE